MTSVPRNPVRPSAGRLAAGFGGLAAVTYALVVLGALVRANGAGLACPDWPLCFGELVPRFDVKVAFEWGHRLLAGLVSLGLAVLSALALRDPVLRTTLRGRLLLAWALLGAQVVLGGLTVLLLLAPWTVTLHLLLGNAFCATLLWIAVDLGEREAAPRREPLTTAARAWLTTVVALLLVQMALGGMVSSNAAGLACAYFPSCDGTSIVPTLGGLVGLHVVHRLNAFALLAALGALAWAARGAPRLARLARAGVRLAVLQIAVGVLNVVLRLPAEVTALHSALAAALLLLVAMTLREAVAARAVAPRPASAPAQALEAR